MTSSNKDSWNDHPRALKIILTIFLKKKCEVKIIFSKPLKKKWKKTDVQSSFGDNGAKVIIHQIEFKFSGKLENIINYLLSKFKIIPKKSDFALWTILIWDFWQNTRLRWSPDFMYSSDLAPIDFLWTEINVKVMRLKKIYRRSCVIFTRKFQECFKIRRRNAGSGAYRIGGECSEGETKLNSS